LFSMVNETGNRNRILERCKFRFWLVHWIDPRSIEHNYACCFIKLAMCDKLCGCFRWWIHYLYTVDHKKEATYFCL